MEGLEGRLAVVTGAAGGIGRAVALRLAAAGCGLALLDRDDQSGTAAAVRELAAGRCIALTVDVGDGGAVARAAAEIGAALGPVDILVNNAGITMLGTSLDTPEEDWRRCFAVNLDGTLHGCRAFVPGMAERRRGAVVNVASWFGKVGKPGYAAYNASKGAVLSLTQTLALEVAPSGVRVNAVCPGTIGGTAMRERADAESLRLGMPTAAERAHLIPLGRLGTPEDVARVVAFLASDEAAYMTGQALNVTGGLWLH